MVDVVSTFIWQATVIHSIDHATYYAFVKNLNHGFENYIESYDSYLPFLVVQRCYKIAYKIVRVRLI